MEEYKKVTISFTKEQLEKVRQTQRDDALKGQQGE